MRTRTGLLAFMLTVGMAIAPAAYGQDYAPPRTVLPLPLFHDRPESGLFFGGEFVYFRQTNPLHHQLIAVRGLIDFDGSITADLNGTNVQPNPGGNSPPIIVPGQPIAGNFLGSGAPALFADDVGPGSYQPGFTVTGGWRFEDGTVIETTWLHLASVHYPAGASLAPPGLQPGPDLADSFLFAPVFNFPSDYAGPSQKLALGNPSAAFGIWNGAGVMSILFTQRFDQWDVTGRIPIDSTDSWRVYGLVGPRLIWLWERFTWRTVSEDFTGIAFPQDTAVYNNIISQRMYGVHAGCGNEWRLGDTPAGTFAVSLDLQAAGLLNVVKERVKYELGDRSTSAQRNRQDYTLVPELEASLSLWWYPIEGVQLRVGYDVMGFFNTVSSHDPVSFNMGGLDPPYDNRTFRLIDGFHAGLAFIF